MKSPSVAARKLDAYLHQTKESKADFARRLSLSDATVGHWIAGYSRPRARARADIFALTGIATEDWDSPSEPTRLEQLVAEFEATERVRRARFEERMATFRAAILARRTSTSGDAV